ncbi:hypothetical protein [Mesorhizobium sp. KR9-304]|uniref:hypothetical protein n=1 Tax=Mesorhizobium sp. KR9-304 TaxID=3156614 RepID=UPI0032B491FA
MVPETKIRRRLAQQAWQLLRSEKVVAGQRFAAEVLDELEEVGRVALIGGALRELRYAPIKRFQSDLDFVVEVTKPEKFQSLVERRGATPNKFGGFRVSTPVVDIDFWDLRCSWAHTSGYKKVNDLEDVLNTTFFNVDAIIYLLSDRKIYAKPGTLDDLERRYLDINLYPNPNPVGATVRALRRMLELDMRASELLVKYIAAQIDEVGWSKIVQIDRAAYPAKPSLGWVEGLFPKNGCDFLTLMKRTENKLPRMRQLQLCLSERP